MAADPDQKVVSEGPAITGDSDKLSSPPSIEHAQVVNIGRENLGEVLPPHESYEGRHRFDPTATWTKQEERRVVRKTDMYLLSWLCVMFFGLQLDRGNLSNALADGFLADMGLTTDDYNNGTTIQIIFFLAAEFPVQLAAKRPGSTTAPVS
ncbi:hypothetical protein MCOR27_011795 [Pyricularia oryzae]|nr:hypothetical protein MCOR27_011795 [Pyricularia oryzae]